MENDVYCNPLSLPDIGPGVCCREDNPDPLNFTTGIPCDFREISDPEMLYFDGTWYMFPSVRQVYVSHDLAHWEYHPLQIDADLGYAPSVTYCNGRFLLTSSVLMRNPVPRIYEAKSPLGPYTLLGEPRLMDGSPITPEYLDPSIFTDDDGRLYLYWGWSPRDDKGPDCGIYGMEMNPENPLQAISEKVLLIDFNPENEWERFGEYHEHLHRGANEGVSMFKHNGEYYLQFAGCGTVYHHYAVSCLRSKVSPLGPFTLVKRPVAVSPHGMVTGSGHGGMIAGPNGTVWQFYTCCLRRLHVYERRIGMDKVEFDANGDPLVRITAVPQSIGSGDMGWLPVSVNKRAFSSSFYGNSYPCFAIDDCSHTWWEPDPADDTPTLTVDCREAFDFQAFRIIWTEPELDYRAGRLPEPVRYQIDFLDSEDNVQAVFDASNQAIDWNVDFRLLEKPVRAQKARLTILKAKNLYRHGVTELTLFAPHGGYVNFVNRTDNELRMK